MLRVKVTHKCLYQHGLLVVLILLGISQGIWQEILGPTLPNLSAKLNVSYDGMGYAMSMRSVGNIMALMLAAIAYDSNPSIVPYLLFVECLVGGIITIVIPWSNNYWMVVVLFFIQSGCQSSMTNGAQLTILKTFKERSIGKMQLVHLGYGIGGVLSGLISSQFLKKTRPGSFRLTKYCTKIRASSLIENITTSPNITTLIHGKSSGFENIYLISGVFAILSAFIFLSYTFVRNPVNEIIKNKKEESWFHKISMKYIAEGRPLFGYLMTMSLFFYYFFYIFGLLTFTPYIVVYAMDPCKKYTMSQSAATYLHTLLNVFFLLGRIIGSFIMDRSPVIALLSINLLNIIFNLILVFLSNDYAMALWIGACGMRLCNSIVYPSGTSFVNRYIIVTSSLISLAILGNTFGSFAGSALGGFLVDNFPSRYITYTCCTGMSMLMATITFMVILGKKNGMREFPKEEDNRKNDKLELK